MIRCFVELPEGSRLLFLAFGCSYKKAYGLGAGFAIFAGETGGGAGGGI